MSKEEEKLKLLRKDVILVIDEKVPYSVTEIKAGLDKLLCVNYCFVYHDKDIYEQDEYKAGQLRLKGTKKIKHYHLLLCFPKRHQLKYYLNLVADIFGVSAIQVSIAPCESVAGAIQYWIHKNEKDKYHYPVSDLVYNFNEDLINDYLSLEIEQKLTTQGLIDLIISSKGDRLKVIEKLGFHTYAIYRPTINDIYKSLGYILSKYD